MLEKKKIILWWLVAFVICFSDEIGVWITPARCCQSGPKRNPNGHVGSQSLEINEKKQNSHGLKDWSKYIDWHCTRLVSIEPVILYWLYFILQENIITYIREFCENEEDEIYHKFINKITGIPIKSSIK